MITQFNRRQKVLATLNFLATALALGLAALFFYGVARFVLTSFDVGNSKLISVIIALGAIAIIFVSGINLQRKGKGNYGYQDSGLMPGWETIDSGGSFMMAFYSNRVTAPAHAFSQIFLCAPLQLIRGIGRLRSQLEPDFALEQRLVALLAEIDSKDKWQTLGDYRDQSEELQCLIRMDKIQFSPRTGKIRSKA